MFERLGLPRRFAVDASALEREYLARSRALHPDFHQLSGSAEQAASVELSALLNEAYATLKDPFRRAEYLLRLAGGPSASELKDMPAEFLEEMLELRMAIAELQRDTPAAANMEQQLQDRRAAMLEQVGEKLQRNDLRATRMQLNAMKYVENLLRDLKAL